MNKLRKTKIQVILITFSILSPFLVKGQIESPYLNFLLNKNYSDDIFSPNEVDYFQLEWNLNTKLPKAKKGKFFCQTKFHTYKYVDRVSYIYDKYFYNDEKKLVSVIHLTLDSATRDTIKLKKDVYHYKNRVLMYYTHHILILKDEYPSNKRNKAVSIVPKDTTFYFYETSSKNLKKGYYLSNDNMLDTYWFDYCWSKTGNSEYQIKGKNKKNDIDLQFTLNRKNFFLYYSDESYASVLFSVKTNGDSFHIQQYSPGINQSQFCKSTISYNDSILLIKKEYYPKVKIFPDQALIFLWEMKLNKNGIPMQIKQDSINKDSKHTSIVYLSYSYVSLIE